jgi:hypothetical protein
VTAGVFGAISVAPALRRHTHGNPEPVRYASLLGSAVVVAPAHRIATIFLERAAGDRIRDLAATLARLTGLSVAAALVPTDRAGPVGAGAGFRSVGETADLEVVADLETIGLTREWTIAGQVRQVG